MALEKKPALFSFSAIQNNEEYLLNTSLSHIF